MSTLFRPQAQKLATLTGHRDCVYALAGAPESTLVYSAGTDGFVVEWDLENPARDGALVARVENSVYALKYIPEQNLLLLGHNFQGVQAIDLQARQLVHATALPPAAIFDIAYSKLRQRTYIALGNGTLAVLHASDLKLERLVPLSHKSLRCLSLHEERNELAVGGSDHLVRILDLETFTLKQTIPGATNSVFATCYSPDGRFLLTAGRDAHLRVWDVAAGYTERLSVVAHLFAINHVTYSPDGRFVATCSMDKSIKLWDADSFRLLRVLDRARHAGHGTSVNKLFWSAHRNRLVSCSDDRTLAVWQISSEPEVGS
ncbi:WD40 repeat domain-containing protein [Hymenobacter sp. BT730]|uniref:WD40 repeat domain-containing protein n=1 Tax=Hymenobacter sp. BT730 TaxID=3063332 RepID=UPI0026DFE69A|nr:WD40 repeat domain-containing protein [Hymenobacter sp. BT730]